MKPQLRRLRANYCGPSCAAAALLLSASSRSACGCRGHSELASRGQGSPEQETRWSPCLTYESDDKKPKCCEKRGNGKETGGSGTGHFTKIVGFRVNPF